MRKKTLLHFLLVALVFVLFVGFLVWYFVVPELDRNVELRSRLQKQQKFKADMEELHESLRKKLQEQKNYIRYLDRNESFKDLHTIILEIDDEAQIERIAQNDNEIVYHITMTIDTPKKFYRLFEDIKKNALPVSIVEPVSFKKEDSAIEVDFFAKAYVFDR